MPLTKPTIGQSNWGPVLNTALDYLEYPKQIPQNRLSVNQSAPYTLTLNDAGKHIYVVGSGYQGIKIPNNTSVAFPIGTVIHLVTSATGLIYVERADSSATTLICEGVTEINSAYDVLANSMARLLKVDTERWFLSGNGLVLD